MGKKTESQKTASVKKEEIDEKLMMAIAELFKVFGDSTRIKILYALLDSEKNVTEISEKLNMSQPAISQQLRVLKSSGLVIGNREGKSIIYSLADDHVKKILNIGMEHVQEDD